MGHDQNSRESKGDVILRSTFCVKGEVHELQISLFFVFLSEKPINFGVSSSDIAKITDFWCEQDFTISN